MFQASVQLYRAAYSGIPKPVWWLAVVMFVNRSGTMVIPFLTVYLTTKGHTLTQAGYVMAAFGIGSVLGSYLGGRLTDRFGPYYVQFGSLLLNGIMFLVLGQMKTLPQYAVCIFALSTVGEAFRPANSTAVTNWSNNDNRTRCYALNRLAINLGWCIGPAVGGVLASIDYAYLFWADGLTCVAASLLLLVFVKPSATRDVSSATGESSAASASPYRDAVFLQGMAYLFLIALAFFQLFSVVPAYYKAQLRLNEATIGWILATNGLVIAAFEMVLVYRLEKRRHNLTYVITGGALIAASFLFLGAGQSVTVALTSMLIVTVGEMFLFPFLNNFWVARSTAANRGRYAGVYTMAWAAASVMAPTLASQVAAGSGFTTLWLMDGLLCGVAALGFYSLKQKLT